MWNRNGVTREVFVVGRWAIKIPSVRSWRLFLTGLLANMQEATFGRMGRTELCPVRFHIPGGWLLVMPRVRVLSDDEFKAISWREHLDADGSMIRLAEYKPDSFGWLDGRLVAIDYGGGSGDGWWRCDAEEYTSNTEATA